MPLSVPIPTKKWKSTDLKLYKYRLVAFELGMTIYTRQKISQVKWNKLVGSIFQKNKILRGKLARVAPFFIAVGFLNKFWRSYKEINME